MNDVIVNGVSLEARFGLVLMNDSSFNPPEPKTYFLDLPGGNGSLDATEVFGDVLYESRQDVMVFSVPEELENFESVKTDLMRFIHGREYDYTLSWDPGYVYRGRFSVDETYQLFHYRRIKIKVTADPYKSAGVKVHEVDVQAGAHLVLKPGRGRVSPVFESKVPIHVISNGVDAHLPAGSHKVVGLSIRDGASNVYVNASDTGTFGGNATWADLKDKTWGQIEGRKWNDVMWGKGAPPANASYVVKVAYEVLEL